MSNSLAIATVTATVARLVGQALETVNDPSGIPRVRFGPPQVDPQSVGCTIFLYRIVTNAFRRNEMLQTRNDDGAFVERPRAALDADYLFTFSGEEATLEPQRFLGAVVAAFQATPVLDREEIRRAIAGTSYLRGSDLDKGPSHVRFTPHDIDQHTMGQLWNTFPQVPYSLSIVYTASAILIDAQVPLVKVPRVEEVVANVNQR